MTSKQKRELIKKLLAIDPGKSNREIARLTKASPTTVTEIRSEMETDGKLSKVDNTTGKDGKTYKARKPPRPKPPPSDDAEPGDAMATGPRVHRDVWPERGEKVTARLPITPVKQQHETTLLAIEIADILPNR
jgi:hypothetical protein